MAGIGSIDTKALALKQAAYSKAQDEAEKARAMAEEKEAIRLKAYEELLAVMQPMKRAKKVETKAKAVGV